MQHLKRNLAAAVLAGAAVAGSSSAYAWQWASSDNPIVMNGGKGYGYTSPGDLYSVRILAYLADTKTGDGRVYASSQAWVAGDSLHVTSERRADGASKIAYMGEKSFGISNAHTIHQYGSWMTQLCRDISYRPDACSDDARHTDHI